MSYVHDYDLPAKVAAVNEANRIGMELYAALVKVFEPLVGQKILKADGTLLKKIKESLPAFPEGARIWFDPSNYSLVWGVSVNKPNDRGHSVYHEVHVYVGKIKGDTLTEIEKPFHGRTDFSVDQVREDRRLTKVAKEAYEEAKRNLHHFGE